MNKFIITGRLTRDIELRYTKDNKEICNYIVAISNGKDDTTFLKITSFGIVAKTLNNYLRKGDMILVEGMIKNNNYEDKEGNKHFETVFMGNKVEFLSTASKSTQKQEQAKKEPKNELDDSLFEDFGKKIENDSVAF